MSFLNAEVHKENLIGKILERLRHEWQELGGEISFYERRGEGYQGILRLLDTDFLCFVESDVSVANYARIRKKILDARDISLAEVLLVSPYIPPTLYDELRHSHINFIDAVGNYTIQHIEKGRIAYLLSSTGKQAPIPSRKAYPLFKEAGLRVVFYLLQNVLNVNQPFRVIKEHSGVAIGSVKNVIDELQERGFILSTEQGRVLCEPLRLLDIWAENYHQVLKPKLFLERFSFRFPEQQEAWQKIVLPNGMWWGGECAAALLQGYLFPEVFTLYSATFPALLMTTGNVRMEAGSITMYEKFWHGDTMPKVLIYADLITAGNSRCIEAAENLLKNELPDFK